MFESFKSTILDFVSIKLEMSKVLLTSHTIKLRVPAGAAKPVPPIGPALGQKGVKSMDVSDTIDI